MFWELGLRADLLDLVDENWFNLLLKCNNILLCGTNHVFRFASYPKTSFHFCILHFFFLPKINLNPILHVFMLWRYYCE